MRINYPRNIDVRLVHVAMGFNYHQKSTSEYGYLTCFRLFSVFDVDGPGGEDLPWRHLAP